MKNLFFLLAFAAAAPAATVSFNCTPFPVQFVGGAGATSASCSGFTAPSGNVITSITLNYLADYQFGTTASNRIDLTFAAPSGFVDINSTLSVLGGTSSNVPITSGSAVQNGLSLASFAAFNVGVSSVVIQGGAATSAGAVSVTYEYSPSNPVPEPSTMALLGSALVGLGAVARRKHIKS